jgi:hypothetical protein
LLQGALRSIPRELQLAIIQFDEHFSCENFPSEIDICGNDSAGDFSGYLHLVNRCEVAGQFDLPLYGNALNACRTHFDSGRTCAPAATLPILAALRGLAVGLSGLGRRIPAATRSSQNDTKQTGE